MNLTRRAAIYQQGIRAGTLRSSDGRGWSFQYEPDYEGPPVSLTLPVRKDSYEFPDFPAFLEGLLPEGPQLEALLRTHKIDRGDAFRQLLVVGGDMVGSLSVSELQMQDD
jgi:serine/threonine-protein kinase HipA